MIIVTSVLKYEGLQGLLEYTTLHFDTSSCTARDSFSLNLHDL